MARKWEGKSGTAVWLLVAGVAAGIAAAIYLRRRTVRNRAQIPPGLRALEDDVLDALRADRVLRDRGVDVAAIAPGILELTGTVENEDEAHHAVAVVQSVGGVRTVLNRLDLSSFDRLRRRPVTTGDSGSGSRWYGMSVGMGRRRQGKSTDPTQRDDHADMLDQSLVPDAEEAMADVVQERIEREARTNEVS
jgi:hypothetical protein